MRHVFVILLAMTLVFLSCEKDDAPPTFSYEEQLAQDIALIEKYLMDEGLVAERTESGLHYIIDVEGTGDHPSTTSDVEVTYKGYLIDGTVFDPGSRTTFNLSRVIEGWTEGIPKFKKGGKGMLIIPSGLAYGRRAQSSVIQPNSILVFDIELHDFL